MAFRKNLMLLIYNQSTKELQHRYIIDGIKFFVELVKPEAESFLETIGFAIYSNNKKAQTVQMDV
jgi:hypothetical protein